MTNDFQADITRRLYCDIYDALSACESSIRAALHMYDKQKKHKQLMPNVVLLKGINVHGIYWSSEAAQQEEKRLREIGYTNDCNIIEVEISPFDLPVYPSWASYQYSDTEQENMNYPARCEQQLTDLFRLVKELVEESE